MLELMIGIAVFAVLVGLGVPSFFEIINNNRTTTQANELVAALNLARSESVKRGNPVSVCSSSVLRRCSVVTSGWSLFSARVWADVRASWAFTVNLSILMLMIQVFLV